MVDGGQGSPSCSNLISKAVQVACGLKGAGNAIIGKLCEAAHGSGEAFATQ